VASRILGDDWLRGGVSAQARGWSYTDLNRMNVGMGNLEYNPNPPAGASAKFRYQARTNVGFWAYNGAAGNPANIQNGKRTWGLHSTDLAISHVQTNGFNGMMFDNGTAVPNISSPPNALLTLSDWSGTTYLNDQIAQLHQETQDLHSLFGYSFRVMTNTYTLAFAYGADVDFIEAFNWAHFSNNTHFDATYDPTSGMSASFDGFADANNPNRTTGVMMTMDNVLDGLGVGQVWYPWERGNRGPIIALATYLMGANSNTMFEYNSLEYIYLDNDDFYYYSAPSTTTQPIGIDTSTAVKNICW
jgi:hypothetical protein